MKRESPEFRLAQHDRLAKLAIRAAVDFANCRVESAEQVLEIFQRLPLPRHAFKTVGPEAVRSFRDSDQREVRTWLAQIVERGNVARQVREQVAKRIQAVDVLSAGLVFEEGILRPQFALSFSGVQACYAYAVALLASRDSDRLAKRLGSCKKCGRFFFDERSGAGGPREYCSSAHKNQLGVWRFANPGKNWKAPTLP